MPIVIKRYPNRKLYDTEAKRYVTLEQIAQLIQNEQEIQVVDNESGEDLTNLTLTQIIFEQEKKGTGLLPRSVLTKMIRAGGDTLEQVRRMILGGAESELSAEETIAREVSSLQNRVDEIFHDVLRSLNLPTDRDLRQLQAQLDELNARVAELAQQEQPGQAAEPSTESSGDAYSA